MQTQQEKLLEQLTQTGDLERYFVDRVKGTVYIRNDMFEAGGGTLYEPIGSLDPKIIEEHAANMDPGRVNFFDDSNRRDTLSEILVGWTPYSACRVPIPGNTS